MKGLGAMQKHGRASFDAAMLKIPFDRKLEEADVVAIREKALSMAARVFDVLQPGKTYRKAMLDLMVLLKQPREVRSWLRKRIAVAAKKQKADARKAQRSFAVFVKKAKNAELV